MAFSIHSLVDALKGFFRKAGKFFTDLFNRVLAAVEGLLQRIPREKRRSVLIIAVSSVAFLLLVISGVSLLSTVTPP